MGIILFSPSLRAAWECRSVVCVLPQRQRREVLRENTLSDEGCVVFHLNYDSWSRKTYIDGKVQLMWKTFFSLTSRDKIHQNKSNLAQTIQKVCGGPCFFGLFSSLFFCICVSLLKYQAMCFMYMCGACSFSVSYSVV